MTPSPDPKEIEVLAGQIAQSKLRGLTRLFAKNAAPPPAVIWRPTAEDLETEQLPFLLNYWNSLRVGTALPQKARIDALEMRPVLGYLMLLDVLEGGADFRYRLYGSELARQYHRDLTKRSPALIGGGNYIATFFLAVYQAVLQRGEAVYTRHAPCPSDKIEASRRLILPLTGEDGASISQLLVADIPGTAKLDDSPGSEGPASACA